MVGEDGKAVRAPAFRDLPFRFGLRATHGKRRVFFLKVATEVFGPCLVFWHLLDLMTLGGSGNEALAPSIAVGLGSCST